MPHARIDGMLVLLPRPLRPNGACKTNLWSRRIAPAPVVRAARRGKELRMKYLCLICFLSALATAQVYSVEKVSGTAHIALFPLDPTALLGDLGIPGNAGTKQKGILIAVMSEDQSISNFNLLLVYKSDGSVHTKQVSVAKQNNPSSAWTDIVLWLGESDYSVLSVEVTESRATAVFSMP